MRVAVFHNLLAGGAKRALYEQVAALGRRGHTVDVYTLSTADEAFMPLSEVAARVVVEPVTLPGLLQTRALPFVLQYLNLARRLGALSALEAAHGRVAEAIDAGGYDMAFVHHDYLAKSPYVLRQLKTPTVYYCQEPLRAYYEHPLTDPPRPQGLKGKFQAWWYGPIAPLYRRRHQGDDATNARAAGRVLANSSFSRESILRAYGIDAHVAPLGVDCERFRPTGARKERAVISVGRFQENKCQSLVIEAVARLDAAGRPKVILVGESTGNAAYRDGLVALAAARGVTLELLEHVSDEALVDAYNRAMLCVFVPLMEPFGFVPLEAGACGVPTVGVREGGVRETIAHGETGLLVERDVEAVAAAVAELLADDARREAMGRRALAHVRDAWTWDASAAALERQFAALISERP